MSEVIIRRLKPEENDDIIALWERAGLSIRPKGRDAPGALIRQMRENPDLFLGAEVEGRLAGVIVATSDGRKGYLNRIAVSPEFRGRGIAQKLSFAAEDALRKHGIKVITLLVEAHNKASIKLALKLGYVRHDDVIYFSKRESPDD
ncbi:GNAT family N-acetyltransferase [candidate division WOR-3 bacterium]|nr:GNAT family N-acetyltransferase [candidate division WOR-3 bacterium]